MLNEPMANFAKTSPELVSGPPELCFGKGRKSNIINIINALSKKK